MEIKRGLNNYQIKIIALILMVIDHIHYNFASQLNIPMAFTIIGRISAPLFIFMTAEGMFYTKDRFSFVKRLYIASVLMMVGNDIINRFLVHPRGAALMNNIFATLFLITYFIFIGGKLKDSYKNKKIIQLILNIFLILLPIIMDIIFIMFIMPSYNMIWIKIFMTFIPMPNMVEGGFIFVLLGILFYVLRDKKILLSIMYILLSFIIFYLGANSNYSLENTFNHNIQWFMVFSLVFIRLYNNEKGKSNKWFFYIFYPAHIYILLAISVFIEKFL